MNLPSFHPNQIGESQDKLSGRLRSLSAIILVVACGFFSLLFVPSVHIPFFLGKAMLFTSALALAGFVFILSVLRMGTLTIRMSLPIVGIWLVALSTVLSAMFSGDTLDSMFGSGLDSYTASFALLMAVTMTAMGIFAGHHARLMRLYVTIVLSALLLSIFHFSRLIFGGEVLSLGIFSSTTASPIGSWNGLAIFYGLIVLLSLLAIRQLPLSVIGRYVVMVVAVLSLGMLAIINFGTVWWVLLLVAGSFTLFGLSKYFWRKEANDSDSKDSWHSIAVAVLIVAISTAFLVFGTQLGGAISGKLNVSFTEVRPSLTATLDLTKVAFNESPIFGAGPNRFADLWREHKDPSINQTIFWNTRFDSGFSFILTHIIGTGLLGLVAWMFFLSTLLLSGIKFIFRAIATDRFWYFIGFSSFVSSIYFWIMSLVYVPPPAILILATITSGVFVVSYAKLFPGPSFTLSVEKSRNYGFVLVVLAILVVSASGYGVYAMGKQALGHYEFSKAVISGSQSGSVEDVEAGVVSAFNLTRNHIFARELAFYQWSKMMAVLQTGESATAEQQQVFQASASRGIEAGQLAINLDPTDPLNHQILAQIYSILAIVGVEGARERAVESLSTARLLDPQNPVLYLLEANMALQLGDKETARALAEEAVRVRPVHTEALFFLAQMDIVDGNVESAIEFVTATVQLEPQNPARRYQLGLLLASADRLDDAISVLESAVALDSQYANARYFLALGYAETGRAKEAIEQLTIVRNLNESNTAVDNLITQLEETGTLSDSLTPEEPIAERDPETSAVTEEDLKNENVTASNPVGE